jgi:tRNA G18 (ribose-2'-O)-methylase SpoU
MGVVEITSERNRTFRVLLSLAKARGIRKHGQAILSGPKQVREVLADFPSECEGIIGSDGGDFDAGEGFETLPRYRVAPPLFRQLDAFSAGPPLLLIRAGPHAQWDMAGRSQGCTLCVPFQDPANVGAVIRSAAAFGAARVVVLKEAAHPFLPKSLRAAGSNILRVPLLSGPGLDRLSDCDTPLIALSPEGRDIDEFLFPPSFCLVPGQEGMGLPDDLHPSAVLSVPMEENVESLNAALATGIALYAWRRGAARRPRQRA